MSEEKKARQILAVEFPAGLWCETASFCVFTCSNHLDFLTDAVFCQTFCWIKIESVQPQWAFRLGVN